MDESDVQLLAKVKGLVRGYLDDLSSGTPKFSAQQVPTELRGHLVDMLYVDKVNNIALVNFLIALIAIPKNRTDQEIVTLLKQIAAALELTARTNRT